MTCRGRWIASWLAVGVACVALAFYWPVLAWLIVLIHVIAERAQPAWLRLRRVRQQGVWLRGVHRRVRERFAELDVADQAA